MVRSRTAARLLSNTAVVCLFGAGCGAGKAAPATKPPAAAPAPPAEAAAETAGKCDKKLFHRWETGKLAENCMSAKACVLDERLVDLSCAGAPDPAACMRKCITSGLGFIAQGYHLEPPDLSACVACVSDGYARMVQTCGATCPACPSGSPEDERCTACGKQGQFFAACLQ
ncbi:MAG: hypothetical protein HYV09_33195 [Deltaproteobacteria bacterium]|nr:hypothetical protein [Deltaproteobacteria bacterium]